MENNNAIVEKAIQSTENISKYTPLFDTNYKSCKLILNRNKDNTYKLNGARIKQMDRVAILPFTASRDEVFNVIYSLFGKSYKRFIKAYWFPKRFIHTKTLIKGPMTKKMSNKGYIQQYIKTRIPDFPTIPQDKVINKKNIILDYTEVLSNLISNSENTLKKPQYKIYSQYIYPELLMKLLYTEMNDIFADGLRLTSLLTIEGAGQKFNNIFELGYDKVIVPIKINAVNIKFLTLPYMSGSAKLTNDMLTDSKTVYIAGFIRFLYKVINNEFYDNGDNFDSYKNHWIKTFQEKNPIFFFYNSKMGFIFDLKELKIKYNWTNLKITKKLKDLLTILIKYNMNEINDEDVDKLLDLQAKEEEFVDDTDEIDPETLEKKNKPIEFILNKFKVPSIIDKDSKYSKIVKNIIESAKSKLQKPTNSLDLLSKNALKDMDDETLENKLSNLFSSISTKDAEEEEEVIDGLIIDDDENDVPDFDNDSLLKDKIKDAIIIDEEGDEIEVEDEDEDDKNIDEELDNLAADLDEEDTKDFNDDIKEYEEEEAQIDELTEDEFKLQESEQEKFFKAVRETVMPLKSAKEIARINLIKDKYKSIKVNDKMTIEELLTATDKTIIDNITFDKTPMRDESFKKCNVLDFERSYLEKTYEKDILNVLKSFSDKNKEIKLHILDYKREDTSDQFNRKETIKVKFEDEDHNASTLKFDIPKMDKNFRMLINGSVKMMKKQIIFLPVVKINPTTVWLTTQYNKMYIERVDYTTNRDTHILKHLLFNVLNDNPNIEFVLGNGRKYNKDILTTIEYDELSEKLISITINPKSKNKCYFSFYQKELKEKIKEAFPDYEFKNDVLPIGIDYGENIVINYKISNALDEKRNLRNIDIEEFESISKIIINYIRNSNILDDFNKIVNDVKIPRRKSYSRIMLLSKKTPLILFLGYLWGLNTVIKTANIPVTITPKPIRGDKRAFIQFKDAYLYYNYYPAADAFLLNGLNYIDTKQIKINDMNTPEPYLEWLYDEYQTRNIAKGWSDFKELCLDGITLEILRDMNLPTDLLELLLYCNDLLGDNSFDHESDGDMKNLYRIRCHEVIPETIYKCIANQYKLLRKAKDPSKVSLSIPQDAVMAKLFKLTTFNNHDVTNPLNELKQRGVVTFKGSTGINDKNAFNSVKRAYGSHFPGIIAMSSPDNFQVGITKQLTANPNIVSTRGYVKTFESKEEQEKATSSELVAIEESIFPWAMKKDDPKRISYMTGQVVHTIKSSGSEPGIVITSSDKIIANVTSDDFAPKAVKDGKVIEIDEKYKKIYLQYDDGSTDFIFYGQNFVTNSSYYFDLNLIPNIKKGEKFKKGDVLAYEKDFFEKQGKQLLFKQGPIVFLCVNESDSTEEDSTFITEAMSDKLKTNITVSKGIVLSKNSNLISFKKIGDHVVTGDPLVVFEDAHDATNAQIIDLIGDIDEETKMETMQKSPRTTHSGHITDIKVYWTCPLDDLQSSLRDFVMDYIKKIKQEAAAEAKITGKPSEKLLSTEISQLHAGRIKKYLMPEEGGVLIEFFISHEQGFSTGDKNSMSTALKSIVMDVVPQKEAPVSEDGLVLDGSCSLLSISARMINSIWLVGFIGKMMYDFKMRMVDYFFDDSK